MADNYSLKAIFANDPEGYNNYKSGQKSGQYTDYAGYLAQGGKSGGNYSNDTVQNAIRMNQEAIKPVVSSLEAEKGPLEKRYQNLLSSIKGNQTTAENRQTLTTANELARRGISNESGVYQQELTNAVNPVTQQYSSQYTDVGLQGDQALRALATQIAQLQSGAASTGITQGIGQQQFNTQQANLQAERDRQYKMDEATRKLNELIYNTIQLPQSQYNINKPYSSSNTKIEDDPFQ